MGISTWDDPSQYGLSLTLGGGAVTALDLSKAYSVVANNGKRPDLMPILLVKDYKGKVLEKNSPKTTQVLDPRVAFLLTDILKDNGARAPEFGLNSYLVVKDHPEVAVKTGTSNDLRDNWTVGFNQNSFYGNCRDVGYRRWSGLWSGRQRDGKRGVGRAEE